MILKITSTDFKYQADINFTPRFLRQALYGMMPIQVKYFIYATLPMQTIVNAENKFVYYPTIQSGINITLNPKKHGYSGYTSQPSPLNGYAIHLYYSESGHKQWEFAKEVMYCYLYSKEKINDYYTMIFSQSDETESIWGRTIKYDTIKNLYKSQWGSELPEFPYEKTEYQALYTYIVAINNY